MYILGVDRQAGRLAGWLAGMRGRSGRVGEKKENWGWYVCGPIYCNIGI